MKTYETTYILSPRETSEKADSVVKEIEAFIQEKKGVILSSQKATAQTLSHPIKKERSGYVATVTFQAAENTIKDMKLAWDKNANILRCMVTVKKPYKEPKKIRTRKPFMSMLSRVGSELGFGKDGDKKKEHEKVNIAEIEKKLEEI